jgi:hypothetical protein
MKRAELSLSIHRGFVGAVVANVSYETVEAANSEYNRIVALMKKREDGGNDIPLLEVQGGTSELSCSLGDVSSIALTDFQRTDDDEKGLRDAFPHIRWRDK